ncbi:unnamed protein product [Pleuronectes platessa]|uniref:Uncharacterized protein n=1 Tax=Pleuronectes platessa TaxID=8262 RepID=A0A9N7U629_PLEPL|nr:unnamed protein product [Pleuronectes platessa]
MVVRMWRRRRKELKPQGRGEEKLRETSCCSSQTNKAAVDVRKAFLKPQEPAERNLLLLWRDVERPGFGHWDHRDADERLMEEEIEFKNPMHSKMCSSSHMWSSALREQLSGVAQTFSQQEVNHVWSQLRELPPAELPPRPNSARGVITPLNTEREEALVAQQTSGDSSPQDRRQRQIGGDRSSSFRASRGHLKGQIRANCGCLTTTIFGTGHCGGQAGINHRVVATQILSLSGDRHNGSTIGWWSFSSVPVEGADGVSVS